MTALLADGPNTPAAVLISSDPWWLVGLKVLLVFVFLMLGTLMMIWFERRVIARMQQRSGPNRAGKFGLLQSLMDGVKLAVMEDIVPRGVDKLLFWLAPVIAAIPAFIGFAVIPFGANVSIFGHWTALQVADLPVAVLLILAMSSMGVYGVVLAGWSSNSPYSLLGALRSSAQVISYEIAMGLSFVPVFLYAGSLNTSQIVAAQANGAPWHLFGVTLHLPSWFVVLLLPSFLIYVITMVGETNRLPFDLPEGEGELVAGFHTEYSSLKFAMFYLSEYVNMFTVSALATTLFLGGWRAPWPLTVWSGANAGWITVLWFLVKVCLFMFFFVWLRGSLPRIRYDQLMSLGWKVLIPVSLAWALLIATLRVMRQTGWTPAVITVFAAILVVVVAWIWAWDSRNTREAERRAAEDLAAADEEAADFPVPPLDLPHYHGDFSAEPNRLYPAGTSSDVKEVTGA